MYYIYENIQITDSSLKRVRFKVLVMAILVIDSAGQYDVLQVHDLFVKITKDDIF